jgi:uncharacterized protein (DUF1697 family)
MTTYIALLRGINVGGNPLKMRRLVEICQQLGLENISTYLQSGNLVFDTAARASTLESTIEQTLLGETRLPVAVVVRSAKQMKEIVAANPFVAEKGIDPYTLHVTCLGEAASKEALGKLTAVKAGLDRFQSTPREIYLHCPMGYGNTKLSNKFVEKALKVKATTRNWNTTNKLCEMANR